jgi:hypothetical protein
VRCPKGHGSSSASTCRSWILAVSMRVLTPKSTRKIQNKGLGIRD